MDVVFLAVAAFCAMQGGSYVGPLAGYAKLLSADIGVPVRVPEDLSHEPLVVCPSSGAPTSVKIRTLVAKALGARWETDDHGRLSLRRDEAAQRGEEAADKLRRRMRIAKWLADSAERNASNATARGQIAAVLQDLATYRQDIAAGTVVKNQKLDFHPASPADALLDSLLAELGSDRLAAVPEGDTRTWTESPRGLQLALPGDAHKAFEVYEEAMDELSGLLGGDVLDSLPSQYRSPWEPLVRAASASPRRRRYVLTCCPTLSHLLDYRIRVYGGDGELIDVARVPHNDSADSMGTGPEPVLPESLPGRAPVSDAALAFAGLLQAGDEAVPGLPRKAGLDPAVLIAEDREPLGLHFQTAFEAVASGTHKDVVAYLPDAAFGAALAASRRDGTLDVRGLLAGLSQKGVASFTTTDDAWLVTPCDPVEARRLRVGRAALRAYARSIVRDGRQSPRADALFCYGGGPGSVVGPVQTAWRTALYAFGGRGLPATYTLLALLGSVSDPQWEELVRGRALPWTSMTPEQKALFERWLEAGTPTHPRLALEPSGVPREGYELRIIVRDDPLVRMVSGDMTSLASLAWPEVRLSVLAHYLKSNRVSKDGVGSALSGSYDIVPAYCATAEAWVVDVCWAADDLGSFGLQAPMKALKYDSWPESVRLKLESWMD